MKTSAWIYRHNGIDWTSTAKPGPLSCHTRKTQWLATETKEVTVVSGNGWVKEERERRSQKDDSVRERDNIDDAYDGSSEDSTVIVGEQLEAGSV